VHECRRVFPAGWQDAVRPKGPGTEGLTGREFAILELVAAGLRNTDIARELMISPNTVKFHLKAVYARLGVRNRAEAAQAFARMRRDNA
jgi:DNA-binding CsgD family transcriptional regulator